MLTELFYAAMKRAATVVPRDVRDALARAVVKESSPTGRLHLQTSLKNFDVSAKLDGLVCTDTGWPYFYVTIGDDVELEGGFSQIEEVAAEAVRRCTAESKLRPTMVHPITRKPLGENVGLGFPRVKISFDPSRDGVRVTAVPKGGGGDVFGSYYKMLLTADGMSGVLKFVLDCFRDSTFSGKTCPPNIIGIGIGGTPDVCMTLAKEACILRPVGDRNADSEIARLELELLDAFNEMGVGPMGCGGDVAALDVHIETAATHTAALAVAFNAQCHIGRRATAVLRDDGEIVFEDDTPHPTLSPKGRGGMAATEAQARDGSFPLPSGGEDKGEGDRAVHLRTPFTESDVRALVLGDHVYLSGSFFTGRSQFHKRAIEQGKPPPIDYSKINVLMHIGPVMRRDNDHWIAVGLDQTSSFRFEKWEADAIRQLGLRAIIGKTTMGARTASAMREFGCVHLTRVGVPGNLLAQKVRRVVDVHHLEEFGMTEATWVLEVEDLGPFIVDIDAQGRNLFHDVRAAVDIKMKALYHRFGIPEDFQYQNV